MANLNIKLVKSLNGRIAKHKATAEALGLRKIGDTTVQPLSLIHILLLPKRVKYRRVHRGRLKGKAMRGNTVTYGDFGLQATEPCWITSNQIEAARIAMTRYTKRGGKVWIKIFPDKPITEKPAETRMGSGKGSPEYWVAVVKPGRVMFEIAGVSEETAREALRLASHKLPVKCKIVAKQTAETENGGE